MGKPDSIKSQRQETQLGVLGTPRQDALYMLRCYDVIMTSLGYRVPMTSQGVWITGPRRCSNGVIELLDFTGLQGVSRLEGSGSQGMHIVIPFVTPGPRTATDVIVQ